ncbi:glycosyltransferase family 4 protein [Antarctobacter jejuensis]|uniref:glycosyltransferase family 4 protein n=1 Tax=Antarctobacter jejuensis TaxID=1439938 RepID=UPI003FCF9DBA
MGQDRLRIAYLSDLSPLDRTVYSGGNARLFDALQKHAGDVTVLPTGWGAAAPVRRLIMAMPETVSLRLRWRMHYALRRVIARQAEEELARGDYDVLFGAYALHAFSGVRTPKGMARVFTSDAVQTVYRLSEVGQAHKRVFAFGRVLDGWLERREREALRGADLLLWPSEWLRETTVARYGLSDDRVRLVPWGANVPHPPMPEPRRLDRNASVHLLVVGRDWFAKGGPVAFDTMNALRDRGVDARLTVIGCEPPEFHRNEHVTVFPQLNKAVPEELAQFNRALREAHFMVMPSFESYGFAFCEAAAHGLPALCLRVGGVPIRDGITGHALPPGSDVGDFVSVILQYLEAPEAYSKLCQSARHDYETRLNWDAWGRTTAQHLQEAVAKKRD